MRYKAGLEPLRGDEIEAVNDAAEAVIEAVKKEGGETFGSRPLLVHLAN